MKGMDVGKLRDSVRTSMVENLAKEERILELIRSQKEGKKR
jgi:hypothetical protein